MRRFHRIGVFLICLAFFSSLGGHWIILQSVAWMRMLGNNLHSDSMKTAVIKTFDGKHPCKMCKKIVKTKSKEKNEQLTLKTQKEKFDLRRVIFSFVVTPINIPFTQESLNLDYILLKCRPPTPPPKA